MSFTQSLVAARPSLHVPRASWVRVLTAEGLSRVLDPAHNVAIWERPPLDASLLASLAAHAATRPAPSAFEGKPSLLDPQRLVASIADRRAARWVAEDIRFLVEQFRQLSGRDHVAAQLIAVPDGACRKLHVDYIGLRLLVTYSGPGTEWVPDDELDRSQLSRADLEAEANNARILREGCEPQRVATNHVVVLKGEHFRGNAGRGAVHRSPPLPAGAPPRLLLKIDVAQCGC